MVYNWLAHMWQKLNRLLLENTCNKFWKADKTNYKLIESSWLLSRLYVCC